ncbi:MAG: CapA family protein [Candidatus Micrarchaeota archaeon]
MLKVAFLGDMMLANGVGRAIEKHGPEYVWGDTLRVLKKADLRISNLECPVSDKGSPWSGQKKMFLFRAPPSAIGALSAGGVDCVSLANNHTLDYGREALLDTMKRLDGAGIAHAGAGKDIDEATRPALLEARGAKISFVAAGDNMPAWEAFGEKAGVNHITLSRYSMLRQWAGALFSWGRVREKIGRTLLQSRARSDIAVFSAHLGPNWIKSPDWTVVRFAKEAMAQGADIFHGHSAHIFQGIRFWGGKPILHDTGDFIDDYPDYAGMDNDLSFIFIVEIDETEKKAKRLILTPIKIARCQAKLARGADAEKTCKKMQSLCAAMGTESVTDEGVLKIRIPQPG